MPSLAGHLVHLETELHLEMEHTLNRPFYDRGRLYN